jgi:AcrR family transcriptional regulator
MADREGNSEEPLWRQRAVRRSLTTAQARAEDRAADLVRAAWELIDERGTTEFTVQDVLARSGQSVRTFYQAFGGKDELLLALLEDAVREQADDLRAVVDEESEPLARLRAYTIRLYAWCEPADTDRKPSSHKQLPIAEFAVQLSNLDPARVEATMEPVSLLLLELVDDAAAAGVIRTANPERAAGLLKQLVMYSWHRNRYIKDPELRITAEEIWDFCLHGFGADPAD